MKLIRTTVVSFATNGICPIADTQMHIILHAIKSIGEVRAAVILVQPASTLGIILRVYASL